MGARLWSRPLWVHALALAGLLIAVAFIADRPFIGYSTDEGAAIIQVQVLRHTGQWIIHDPVAPVDPQGVARPIPRADAGSKGRAPYGKHPLYPLILLAADAVMGTAGYVAVSILGTVGAAVAAALLARRFDPRLDRIVLWAVGVGSPLFFDAFLVLAHSIGAALAGLAALAAVEAVTGRGGTRRSVLLVAGVGLTSAALVLVRSEGLLFDAALATATLTCATVPRRRIPSVAVAAAAAVGALAARLGEGAAVRHILGAGGRSVGIPGASESFLQARLDAARSTLFKPAYGIDRDAALLAIGLAALCIAALLARVGADRRRVVAVAAVGPAGYIAWLASAHHQGIPGLFVAWPLAAAGLLCWSWRPLAAAPVRIAAVTAGLSAAAVLATEYSFGGGVEWGGRFFAVTIPVAAGILVLMVCRLPSATRGPLVAGLSVTAVVVAVLAVSSLRHVHEATRSVFAAVDRCAASTGGPRAPALGAQPLVVTAETSTPQIDWPEFDRYQWLAPDRKAIGRSLAGLSTAGVERFVLLSAVPDKDLAGSGYRMVRVCHGAPVSVWAVQAAG